MKLSNRIFLGLGLGIALGLFLGELAGMLSIVGDAFVLLLQMSVLPYVTVSLISSLGRLSYSEAGALARYAGLTLIALWSIALFVVVTSPLAYPEWEAASFFSASLVAEREPFDFLGLYIPANPFRALSEGVVPAVVLFSIVVGVTLISVESKLKLIEPLETLVETLGRVTDGVIRLAPYGVFAIGASAAGTLEADQFRGLQVYGVLYASSALLLALCAFPLVIASVTPFRYRDVVGRPRAALVTAFATGSLFVVLSLLAERTGQMLRELEGETEEAERIAGVVVPASFNVPSSGKLLTLAFLPFAGWLSGYSLGFGDLPNLLTTGVLSFFGSTLVAIPFLLELFRIPSDLFQLFVVADNILGARFGALVATMHVVGLTLITGAAVAGRLEIKLRRLLPSLGLTLLLFLATFAAIRLGFEWVGHSYDKYERLVDRSLTEPVTPSRVRESAPDPLPPPEEGASATVRLRERGMLRVGFVRDTLPYAFRNLRGELVGFDVDLAHRLAHDLGVGVEFVQIGASQMAPLLNARYLDIVMSGNPILTDLLPDLAYANAHRDETLALVVRDFRRQQFSSRSQLRVLEGVRIALPSESRYLERLVRSLAPKAEIVPLSSPRLFFREQVEDVDALAFSAERGSSWSLIYPQFAVAVPQPRPIRVPLGYPVARDDGEMARLVSSWMTTKRKDGTLDELFGFWIRGETPEGTHRRWSVIRDVLGWVD